MSKQVMLVDDERLILDLAVMGLRSIGIENIRIYNNARSAYTDYKNALKSKPFDLIISDWQMPEMTGLELLKKIRQSDQKTPFIMLTSTTNKEGVTVAIQAHVTDYIGKPFKIEQFLQKVSRYL